MSSNHARFARTVFKSANVLLRSVESRTFVSVVSSSLLKFSINFRELFKLTSI